MKKVLVQKIRDLFNPTTFYDLDVYRVFDALKDDLVRKTWLFELVSEIKAINLKIDAKLASGDIFDINDLSAQRRTLQFVLEKALEADRQVKRDRGHNPAPKFDLDAVTVGPAL